MRKFEVARMLGKRYDLASYLEVVTPTTGGTYAEVDRNQFRMCTRLMYRCPAGFSDGLPIHLRAEGPSSEDLFFDLLRRGQRFDLVFIDPFHTYSASLRDILLGLQLLRPNGIMLIHDCDPPTEELATPEHQEGDWCGVTYAAFLDIVLGDPRLSYATVTTDYGCGIISPRPRRELLYANHDRALAADWQALGASQKFGFFIKNRARLLHLISPTTFSRPLESRVYGAYRAARRAARDVLNALT